MILHVEYPSKPAAKTGWSALARWAGLAALGVFGLLIVLALFVAATAAAVIGLIVAAAMIVLRLAAPKPVAAGNDLVLEGRRTAEGWVVEAEPRR
jgi:hypothetical protein